MRGIKIPLQDFALKMKGGLMREGGEGGHNGNSKYFYLQIRCGPKHLLLCLDKHPKS